MKIFVQAEDFYINMQGNVTRSLAQGPAEDDASLATRAAWLHLIGGLTQGEVAARLNVGNVKAHRLIARANREGLVQVFIDGDVAACLRLEEQICKIYGLAFCDVAPDLDEGPLPLRSLGALGARFLRRAFERGEDRMIGLGHGRTLAACVNHLPRAKIDNVRFVSLLGGFTRKFAANPFDVIHRIAERTGAEAYVMPLPFLLNSAEDRAVLMAQKGIDDVFALARQATLHVVGLGTVNSGEASLTFSGLLELHELADIRRAGGCGEVLGHFFDADGRRIETELTARMASLSYDDLGAQKMVAVAGGLAKPAAIRAVLRSGLVHGLITDEKTARDLVVIHPDRSSPSES